MIHSDYLGKALDAKRNRLVVDNTIALIQSLELKYSTVVFRGMSGALVAPLVAYAFKKNITIIRKPDDDTHSVHSDIEGYYKKGMKYIVIDDLISSGKTIKEIVKTVQKNASGSACQAIILWDSYRSFNNTIRTIGKEKIKVYTVIENENLYSI